MPKRSSTPPPSTSNPTISKNTKSLPKVSRKIQVTPLLWRVRTGSNLTISAGENHENMLPHPPLSENRHSITRNLPHPDRRANQVHHGLDWQGRRHRIARKDLGMRYPGAVYDRVGWPTELDKNSEAYEALGDEPRYARSRQRVRAVVQEVRGREVRSLQETKKSLASHDLSEILNINDSHL